MPVSATFELKFDARLQSRMKRLSFLGGEAVGRRALTAASEIIVKAAKAKAPVGVTKRLKNSIRFVIRNYRSGRLVSIIGPELGVGGYGHLVEFGTRQRYTDMQLSRGIMPPQPFLRPAVLETRGQVRRVIRRELFNAIRGIIKGGGFV